MNQTPRIEYVPPKSETIRAFARKVCETLAAQTNDPIYMRPDVIRGFAGFLELAAQVQAKRLNNEQLVDSDAN
jgi:hypothetical protein